MKTKRILIAVFTFFIVTGLAAKNDKTTFKVEMDCQACVQKIKKNMAFERGVKGLDVELEKDLVTVTYNASKTDIAKLQKGFAKIGYEAIELKATDCCTDKAKAECKQACADGKKATEACKTTDCDGK